MSKAKSYKETVEELEEIIRRIETDEPDIDELSILVKKAAKNIKSCKERLRTTEENLNDVLSDLED